MKLDCSARYTSASSYNIASGFVDEQQYRRDKRRQAPSQFSRTLRGDGARAFGVEHKTNGIGARSHSGIYVSGSAQKEVPQTIHDWLAKRSR